MFYCFIQNNSGGIFEVDEDVAPYVIVEADTPNEANKRAENVIGIYFDGCDIGNDCPCCGDRWYPVSKYGSCETPQIYGTPVSEFKGNDVAHDEYYAHVYYADGRKESYSH